MKMPPPVIALIAVITLFIVHWMLPFLSIRIPGQSILGGLLILAGIAVAVVAVRGFFQAETTIRPDEVDKASTLVTSGLYRFTRNPMYLGLALLIAGIGLGLGTMFVPIVLAVFVWVITTKQIIPEERALENIFGQDYVSYKNDVRRWI